MTDPKMLTEAGFVPAWFEDVVDGDTIMVDLPAGSGRVGEFKVSDLRPSTDGPTARRFITTSSDGVQCHATLGGEYPCWILRRTAS